MGEDVPKSCVDWDDCVDWINWIYFIGENCSYSTHAWTLVSAVIEGASGRKFETIMTELFRDMALKNTYLEKNDPLIYGRCRFYTRKSLPSMDVIKKRTFYRQAHHKENHCERKVQLFWEFENFRHIFFIRHTGLGSLTVKTRKRKETSRLCLKWWGNLSTLGKMKA